MWPFCFQLLVTNLKAETIKRNQISEIGMASQGLQLKAEISEQNQLSEISLL